ncbi:MAG: YchJ family protein [Pseudomonadota bacterium]
MTDIAQCPCGSGKPYAQCCAPWHDGTAAPTAEALMRSRYAAFVLEKVDYLLATWHPSTRPAELVLDAQLRWLGLEVRHSRGGSGDDEGEVEFVARCKLHGKAGRLHEVSRFVCEEGRWYYVDGVMQEGKSRRR